jgi:hypothetical protein
MSKENKIELLQKQIEYYLSDKNLQHDTFFYEKIAETKDGYIDANLFLNCNNIKKLDVKIEDVILACKNSSKVDCDKKHLLLRRKDNLALPNFLGRKRDKDFVDEKERKKATADDPKVKLAWLLENEDPIILYLSSDKDQVIKWKELSKKLKELYPEYECVYIRFSFQKGQAALFSKDSKCLELFKPLETNTVDENLHLKETNEVKVNKSENSVSSLESEKNFNIDGVNLTSRLAKDKELAEFWKTHGSHYEFCITSRLEADFKNRNNKQPRVNKNNLKSPVTLGGEM